MPRATSAKAMKRPAAASARSRSPRGARGPSEFNGMKAFVITLERRSDRWDRVSAMLKEETPWLDFVKFPASDGSAKPISEEEVTRSWNTKIKAIYAGCGEGCEWVFDAPGKDLNGQQWRWASDVKDDDLEWTFFKHDDGESGTVTNKSTHEKFSVRKQVSQQYLDGQTQGLSGGERGCAHSHLRLWRVAAERKEKTLVLEDDVQFSFERSEPKLGMADGTVFTDRLRMALKHAPSDCDVLYLGWSGHRGGNFKVWNEKQHEKQLSPCARKYLRRAEYVWTTVAYVITQAGAKKLLAAANPLNMPVDEFMAAEACQGRLKSYVAMDKGDDDQIWAGGLVDQFDFQGDSDIKKSDGGVQGDSIQEFVVK